MAEKRLRFFDLGRGYYSAYYLQGFSEIARDSRITLSIRTRPSSRLRAAVRNEAWQSRLFAVSIFSFEEGGRERTFCIDAHDAATHASVPAASGYHLPLLREVDLYFKVNYDPAAIARAPELDGLREKILPVSQFVPVRPHPVAPFLLRLILPPLWHGVRPGLEHTKPWAGYRADARRRILDIRNFLPLSKLLKLRDRAKTIDILFATGYHAHPDLAATMEERRTLMEQLSAIEGLRTELGLSSYAELPPPYSRWSEPRLKQPQHLERLARARVIIYTRGAADCISSKFALAMALGIPMIGETIANQPGMVAEYPHLQEQFACESTRDIVREAETLARDEARCRRLGAKNAQLFDERLAPAPTAKSILDSLP